MPAINNITGTSGASGERLLIMDDILSKRKFPISKVDFINSISEKLGRNKKISPSTFDKDLKLLKEALKYYSEDNDVEITLDWKKDHHTNVDGYIYSVNSFKLYSQSINEDDKNLLLYARNLFDVFKGTSIHQEFNNIVKRLIKDSIILEERDGDLPEQFVHLDKGFHVDSKKWLPQILDAILNKKCIEVEYMTNKKVKTKKHLCPYVIKQHNYKWYTVAFDHTSSRDAKTNVFLLDNVIDIGISTKAYIKDEKFDAENYFKYSLGIWHEYNQAPIKVTLEFNQEKVFQGIVNNPLHHSQQIVDSSNDKLTLTIEVYNSPELYSMIHSYGAGVKVVSPATVIEKVKENARKMLELYT
jgi:predicted DNA-binding transcriptional regulator YafY